MGRGDGGNLISVVRDPHPVWNPVLLASLSLSSEMDSEA